MNDLETRLGGGFIDKGDEYAGLSSMFWKLIEHRCSEEDWTAFLMETPKLRKYR